MKAVRKWRPQRFLQVELFRVTAEFKKLYFDHCVCILAMSRLVRRILEGDNRERLVCPDCDFVAYENPKIVVGSVVAEGDRVLLCRRAIEPRSGFWTIPAGYMEMGETVTEGAQREAWEEARARIAIDGVLAVYSIARLGQVQVIFRGRLGRTRFCRWAGESGS